MEFVEHPLIKEKSIEKRAYQESIVKSCRNKNSLVVLPTGLGKTPIACIIAAERLMKYPDSKILIMAPTKPLVEQHKESFSKFLKIDEDKMVVLTGKIKKEKRKDLWQKGVIFFATPQIVKRDIDNRVLDLSNFSLLVFDEAHRAVGDYDYVKIAKMYMEVAKHPLILALTASPGGNLEKIGSICGNLFIENVEIKTEDDPDVKPYVEKKEIKWIRVNLDEEFLRCISFFKKALNKRLKKLREMGFLRKSVSSVTKSDLLELQRRLSSLSKNDVTGASYTALAEVAASVKLMHVIELLESQGSVQALEFLEKLKDDDSKSSEIILNDEDVIKAKYLLKKICEKNKIHPKLPILKKIIEKETHQGKKCIIFTQYVKTAEIITEYLKSSEFIKPVLFVGQRKGMTQKKQIEVINMFRKGIYNVLVSSSVGEEGLDIPQVDVVVFYEPVPSEIRAIQRRGRTGRLKEGKVIVLMTHKSVDDAYYWSAIRKERRMRAILKKFREELRKNNVFIKDKKEEIKPETTANAEKTKTLANFSSQMSLDNFVKKDEKNEESKAEEEEEEVEEKRQIIIYADDREKAVIDYLKRFGVDVRVTRLPVADFQISERVGIERKTINDFANSIIDGRIFNQAKELCENFERPLIIIEGDIYSLKNREININSIKGALLTLAIDYRIPIIFTRDALETAIFLVNIAKKEQLEEKKPIQIKLKKSFSSIEEMQRNIIASLPGINATLADRLLKHFGNVKNVFNAGEVDLQKVEGIGKCKARKVVEIVNKKYKKNT